MKHGIVDRKRSPTHKLLVLGDQQDSSFTVEFDVCEDGLVKQPNIFEVQDTILSQEVSQQILEQVGHYWYEHLVINEDSVRIDGVLHRIVLLFQEN